MLVEREAESCYLGQFIPVQYHHNMLMDANRMDNFKAAIQHHVFEGAKVLELGGGTGVLSWFAAQSASRVYCVEFNPDMVAEARRLLAKNRDGHKVEVIHADAFEYMPPEPVDFVICEMIHVAMLREKQVEVIEGFKRRYAERFPDAKMPVFIPEAVLMAVQPLQETYDFWGYQAPIIQFTQPGVFSANTQELGNPVLYSVIDFCQPNELAVRWQGSLQIETAGTLTALRFVTKNVLAVLLDTGATIDWLNHYMAIPVPEPMQVNAGDIVDVSFAYHTGAPISALQNTLRVSLRQQTTAIEEMRTASFAVA